MNINLSDKKKILILCTNANLAGAPLYVLSVIKNLKNEFNFIVVMGENGSVVNLIREEGVNVIVVPTMRSMLNPIYVLITFVKVIIICNKFQPSILYAHSSMAGMISRLSTLTLKIPTIYTVHGWGWRGLNIINKNFIILIEKLFKHIPNCFYIYVSESVESDAINYLKISKKKAKLILNGTADYKVFSQTKLTSPFLQMIMPARVSSAKDHNTLLSAFEMSNINSNLMLCGAGTNDADFIYKASKLAPNRFKDIQFLGERSDINFLYNQSDIFLLISKFEALPLSILEAMSAGKAIIASRVGSIPEFIIDGKNGILVNISDVNDLVLKINSLNDINLRITLGKEARLTYLKNFTIDKMIVEIKTLFFTKTILIK